VLDPNRAYQIGMRRLMKYLYRAIDISDIYTIVIIGGRRREGGL
jgi:hypothetical protein